MKTQDNIKAGFLLLWWNSDQKQPWEEKCLSYNLQYILWTWQCMIKRKQDRNSRNWKTKAETEAEI